MSNPDTTPSAAELRAEVERTRQELGETVDALTHRLDVKARVRRRVDRTRASLTRSVTRDPRRTAIVAGAVGVLGGAVVLIMVRRSR